MNKELQADFYNMKKMLKNYFEKGPVPSFSDIGGEPAMAVQPTATKISPLKKVKNCSAQFFAVDCSTRTLKRASNWGVYLMRIAYASVNRDNVDWSFKERMAAVIGDRRERSNYLTDLRLQLESEMALKLLHEEPDSKANSQTLRKLPHEGDYVILDGASYFGGRRGFHISLYEEALRKNINLLAISKQSSTLRDHKGRDFIATAYMLAPYPIWTYYPVKEANKDKHRYGDVSLVKLCKDSPRVFRCDIMEYLTKNEIPELLSPLTTMSEDPRCLGYPIALWLAHDFSAPSNSKLLHYHNQVEEALADVGLLDRTRMEELACNFPDELHGSKYAFNLELVEHV